MLYVYKFESTVCDVYDVEEFHDVEDYYDPDELYKNLPLPDFGDDESGKSVPAAQSGVASDSGAAASSAAPGGDMPRPGPYRDFRYHAENTEPECVKNAQQRKEERKG